jgi:hypothetical protein
VHAEGLMGCVFRNNYEGAREVELDKGRRKTEILFQEWPLPTIQGILKL